jgi:hypothetical protein
MHLGGQMGMPPNQGYGMGAYGVIGGQASPPREQREVVLTHHWQTQLQRADVGPFRIQAFNTRDDETG